MRKFIIASQKFSEVEVSDVRDLKKKISDFEDKHSEYLISIKEVV